MAKQLSNQVLEYLDKHNEANSLDLSTELGEHHDLIIGAIKSLQTFDDVSLFKLIIRKLLYAAEYLIFNLICTCWITCKINVK